MQKFSNFQKLLKQYNSQNLIKIQFKRFAFNSNKNSLRVSTIDQIGQEYKNSKERISSSVKPKTLAEIKKIRDFVKTKNSEGKLEE